MLYNVFVCFVTGLTGIVVFWLLQRTRKEKEVKYSQHLDYFSLLLGLMWILTGSGVLFVWLGRLDLEAFTFQWFLGPLVYIHLLPAFYYFGWSFFKNRKTRLLFDGLFTCTIFLAVFTLFQYGFERSEITYWGSTSIPNELTNNIFTFGVFLPAFLCIIIEFGRRLRNWIRTGSPTERQLFGFISGFLIYALMGFFDALAIAQGWVMLLLRIGEMIAPLVFYLSATIGREE